MFPIIGLVQFHAVIIDHAITGHSTAATVNEQDGSLGTIQRLQLLNAGAAPVGIHVVVTANGFQI